jgi:hypothetical protein
LPFFVTRPSRRPPSALPRACVAFIPRFRRRYSRGNDVAVGIHTSERIASSRQESRRQPSRRVYRTSFGHADYARTAAAWAGTNPRFCRYRRVQAIPASRHGTSQAHTHRVERLKAFLEGQMAPRRYGSFVQRDAESRMCLKHCCLTINEPTDGFSVGRSIPMQRRNYGRANKGTAVK